MKKVYSKPGIMFESFTLSTNIAGDCDEKTNLISNQVCGMEAEGVGTIFLEGMGGCNVPIADGAYDGICYDTPTNDKELFNS